MSDESVSPPAPGMENVSFSNEATGETTVICVTVEEAKMIKSDIFYATKVYNQWMGTAGCESAAPAVADSREESDPGLSTYSAEDTTRDGNTYRWPHASVLLFIQLYQDYQTKFASPHYTNKAVWGMISDEMIANGYHVTGIQCDTKWTGLRKIYKKYKDHNSTSGNNRKNWLYFDAIDEILGQRPEMSPVSTASSSGTCTVGRVPVPLPKEAPTASPTTPNSTNIGGKVRGKEKKETVVEMVRQMREERRKRHEEKMEAKNKLLKLLERIADGKDD